MSNEPTPAQEPAATLMARVFALVRACPPGKVTTYGWLARTVGYPRGARMVGWFMSECPPDVPAQRVINSKGELSGSVAFGQPGRMRQLLEAEGIVFSEDERVDLKRYGWDPARDLTQEELAHILHTAASVSIPSISKRLRLLIHTDAASPFRDPPSSTA